jgi:uncharacterized membrane protein YedE/YeeE
MALLTAFACGLIFGLGLVISGMTQTPRVLGFLDIFGTWDPSLVIVMMSGLIVALPGTWIARRRAPILADVHHLPNRTVIDRPLVIGAMLFGIGWGLVGLCPGPALANLATLSPAVIVFVLAMAAGILLRDYGPDPLRLNATAAAEG